MAPITSLNFLLTDQAVLATSDWLVRILQNLDGKAVRFFLASDFFSILLKAIILAATVLFWL